MADDFLERISLSKFSDVHFINYYDHYISVYRKCFPGLTAAFLKGIILILEND